MSAMKLLLWPQKREKPFTVTKLLSLPSCSPEVTAFPDTGVAILWCTLNENTEFEIKKS